MRKATENEGTTRILAECFSPENKVKDFASQRRSIPHFTSLHQETPMKPSQVPNRLSHPPPRRVLPLQTSESCYRDRLDPHSPGSVHSQGFAPSIPTNISSPVNRPHYIPKDRLGPPKYSPQHPVLVPSSPTNVGTSANRPQPVPRDRLDLLQHSGRVPVIPTNVDTSTTRPQPSTPSVFHPASPQIIKNLSNHFPSSHIGRDQVTESKLTSSNSGNKTASSQRQDLHTTQSSDVKSSTLVQLHRPPVSLLTSVLNTRVSQEVHPQPHSDSERWHPGKQWSSGGYQPPPDMQSSDRSSHYSSPIIHSSAALCQSQQHEQPPPSERLIPAVDLNCTPQKRCRESDYCYENAKKLCLQGLNSGSDMQTTKPAIVNSSGTSLVCQPSSKHSSVLELSPKTTNGHLGTELASGPSACSEISVSKPTQSSCTSKRPPPMGAKQAYINFTENEVVKLKEIRLPVKSGEESGRRISEENDKKDKSSTLLSSKVPQRDIRTSCPAESGSSHSGHTSGSTSVLPVKTPSKGNHGEHSRKSDISTSKPASKPNSGSLSCGTPQRNKTHRVRKPVVVLDDINDLFTPDPKTYIVSPGSKTAKPKIQGETIKSPTSEKGSSSTVTSSSTPATGSPCNKTQSSPVTDSAHRVSSPARDPQMFLPTVTLKRINFENVISIPPKDKEVTDSPLTSSGMQPKNKIVKSDHKHASLPSNNANSCSTEAPASESTSRSSQPLPLERKRSQVDRKQVKEEEPIDVELDLGLHFELDVDLTQSSISSEEEELISLQEMMERVTKPPATPEKGVFSNPDKPVHRKSQPKTQPLPSTTKSGVYRNSLDQMLMDINTDKKAKEIEAQLLTACEEDLLRIAEYEKAEEIRDEGISAQQQEFLQRYSLMSSAIREVPPGEKVFNLEKFGQIFNQDTLQLRQCMVNPQGTAQKTLLWSSAAQLRLHVNIGLFQEAYNSSSPCPSQVTRFLFKMMSVHSDRMVSEKILQALCDIACTAAYQIVENKSQQFQVWVPSLADVTVVLMNMGISFVTLFPLENLLPPFTEGDLLDDVYIISESPSINQEQIAFPEHNCNNILKYLSYCMSLCPRAYSDNELLLLLTMAGRVGLDTQLIHRSSVELHPVQWKIVNNIKDWDAMLPRICLAIADMTDDHHNMCLLVHLLPNNTRGKQLRRHLSLSMISKLLDGNCTYRPTQAEFQLSDLRRYLPRMQPSTLLQNIKNSSDKKNEEDMAILDQQSYYLCYSLLTLANEASNFQFFPGHQKEQLLFLSSELETHIKCDIRESEKCLYRTKVKDLVARIYTKWQMLLQRTRPLNGKLYDYWQPGNTALKHGDGDGTSVEEVPTEEPTEESMEESTEEPAEESAEEPTKEPAEESAEEPTKEPAEESAEEPTKEPAEESAEEPTKEPAEESAEEPTKEPAEDSAEEPAEESAEEPTKEPAEESVEEPTKEPAEESVEESKEDSVEEATEEAMVEATEEATKEATAEATEEPAMEENEEADEANIAGESDVLMVSEDEEEEKGEERLEIEGDHTTDKTVEQVIDELKQMITEMEPRAADEKMDAAITDCADADTGTQEKCLP